MATTALDLVGTALTAIGELGVGEVMSAEDASIGFNALNSMIDSWTVERLNVYTITKQQFTLQIGKQYYTFGAAGGGADFTSVGRPVEFLSGASIAYGTDVYTTLSLLDFAAWMDVTPKNASASICTRFYPDNQYPNMGVYYWPVPTAAISVEHYMILQLSQFATLTTPFVFPPSYLQAMTYGLAMLLCSYYTKPVPPDIAAEAARSKNAMQAINAESLKAFFAASETLAGANKQGPLPAPPVPIAAPPR